MSHSVKHTFYPVEEVASELQAIPRGKLSERVNELILKGLSAERQDEIALAYQTFDAALAHLSETEKEPSEDFMSEGLFAPEDEVEDFI